MIKLREFLVNHLFYFTLLYFINIRITAKLPIFHDISNKTHAYIWYMYYWVYLYQYIENVIKNVIFIIHLANFTLCFCFLIHQDWVLLWWARRLWLFFSYHIITEPNICLKYYSPKTHKYLFGYFLKQFYVLFIQYSKSNSPFSSLTWKKYFERKTCFIFFILLYNV